MIGPLAFLAPWLLAGLVALPILWWLLRAVPPAPARRPFPGVRLLLGLTDPEKMPERTPWWLLLLRMLALAAAILAFAGPVLNPRPEGSDAPLLILIDGGWATRPTGAARLDRAAAALDEASRDGRPAAIVSMADRAAGRGQHRLRAARPTGRSGWPGWRRAPGRRTAPPGRDWLAGAGRRVRDPLAQRRHRPRRRGASSRRRCWRRAR